MNFFKHQDLDSGWWGLLEGTNIENATIIKVSDGTQPLLSPYPNQIEMIIDDLERFGEMNIDSGVLEVPQGCLYNIYSLSFHLDELKTSIEENIGFILMRDELFFNTGNGPPLEDEQIKRKAKPMLIVKELFGKDSWEFMLKLGIARFYYESIDNSPDGELSVEEFNDQVGVGELVSYENFLESDFFLKFLNLINDLSDQELVSLEYLNHYFKESCSLNYLLLKGHLRKAEFLKALLACRYELLDIYIQDETNLDYREAYSEWENEVSVALNYSKIFKPPDRTYLLELTEDNETEVKEFKASLRYDTKTREHNKDLYFGIVKSICGMANNEGGKILIGYHEKENTFIGIEKDGFLNVDEWELNLRNRIKEKAGEFVQTLLNVEYLKYEDGVTCALINVENSEEDIMCKQQNSNKKEFYLRKGARTAALDIEEYSKHKAQKEIN